MRKTKQRNKFRNVDLTPKESCTARLNRLHDAKQVNWMGQWATKQIQKNKSFNDVLKSAEVYRPKRKYFIATCVTIIVLFAVLLTVASFFDYQIDEAVATWALPSVIKTSKNVYEYDFGTILYLGAGSAANQIGQIYTNSIYGKIIEVIGVAPTTLITMFANGIIFWNLFRMKNKGGRIALQALTIFLSLFWFWFTGFFTYFPQFIIAIEGLENWAPMGPTKVASTAIIFVVMSLVLGGILSFAIFAGLKFVKVEVMNELLRWAMIVSSAALFSIITMEVLLKPVLCRERFRFIYAFNQIDYVYDPVTGKDWTPHDGHSGGYWYSVATFGGFKNWYELGLPLTGKPFHGGNTPFLSEDITKSFPSGHMTMAACGFLSLLILPRTVRACNTRRWKLACWITAPLGTAVFGFARLVSGAHYLSDILAGALIAGGFLFIFYLMNTWGSRYLDKLCGLQIYPLTKRQLKAQIASK